MEHLPFEKTPISSLSYYSEKLGVNLFAKRDDLFAEAGGGSKARMLQYLLADVNPNTCDVLVTAGGPCSNFNRACALMCAKLGVPMHLVEYADDLHLFETSLNYYICNLASIRKTRCLKSVVPQTIQEILNNYQQKGIKARFIYGGGKSLEGIYAYYDAVKELKNQGCKIDYVFVACGTGTTLSGISAGLQEFYPNAIVHAISTARTWEAEKKTLEENASVISNYLNYEVDFNNLLFAEDYLCGGYAKYSKALMNTITECISHEGMLIDPTYSGKAFWGMTQIIESNMEQYKGKNICFFNTGGIFNLLSAENTND